MSAAWVISYLVLWAMVLLIVAVVVALARQIGQIHIRLGQAGARMTNTGLGIGDAVPALNAVDIDGHHVELGTGMGRKTLLIFISPSCPSCEDVGRGIRSIFKNEGRRLDVILVSLNGDEASNRDYIKRHRLLQIPYVASMEIALRFGVANPPYALLVDEKAKVQAKGMVNNLVHLESLLNAGDIGHPSAESFFMHERPQEVKASS
jgi:methylamine dehydrogenase accessory protein MauD